MDVQLRFRRAGNLVLECRGHGVVLGRSVGREACVDAFAFAFASTACSNCAATEIAITSGALSMMPSTPIGQRIRATKPGRYRSRRGDGRTARVSRGSRSSRSTRSRHDAGCARPARNRVRGRASSRRSTTAAVRRRPRRPGSGRFDREVADAGERVGRREHRISPSIQRTWHGSVASTFTSAVPMCPAPNSTTGTHTARSFRSSATRRRFPTAGSRHARLPIRASLNSGAPARPNDTLRTVAAPAATRFASDMIQPRSLTSSRSNASTTAPPQHWPRLAEREPFEPRAWHVRAILQQMPRDLDRLPFQMTAADRMAGRVARDEHLGAGFARRGAVGARPSRKHGRFAVRARAVAADRRARLPSARSVRDDAARHAARAGGRGGNDDGRKRGPAARPMQWRQRANGARADGMRVTDADGLRCHDESSRHCGSGARYAGW